MRRRTKVVAISAMIAVYGVAGCSGQVTQPNQAEQARQVQIQSLRDKNQPIPMKPFSEKRQVAIDILNAQTDGVATTTFFFTQGVPDPSFQCPSLGFPLPGSTQLTNPAQVQWDYQPNSSGTYNSNVLHQMDPDGTYVGDTSGMYVECVAPNGKSYIVHDGLGTPRTIGGPAHWDTAKHTIVLDGDPTAVTPKSGPHQ